MILEDTTHFKNCVKENRDKAGMSKKFFIPTPMCWQWGEEGEMRKLLLLTTTLTIFVLLISCGHRLNMPKEKVDDMAKDCCVGAAKKFVYYNSIMRDDMGERSFFIRLNHALNQDHPILVRKMDYDIQGYNKDNK